MANSQLDPKRTNLNTDYSDNRVRTEPDVATGIIIAILVVAVIAALSFTYIQFQTPANVNYTNATAPVTTPNTTTNAVTPSTSTDTSVRTDSSVTAPNTAIDNNAATTTDTTERNLQTR